VNHSGSAHRCSQTIALIFALFGSFLWVALSVQSASAAPTWQSAETNPAQNDSEAMPIDRPAPTEGSGAATPAKRISFLSLLTLGGWFMVPLLILSILVVTIGVERFLALRREKIFPPELVRQFSLLTQSEGGLDPRRAYQACQRYPSSASYVMRAVLVKVGRSQSEMESAVTESAQREATRLARMSSWLTLAAAIAPLIGLLGTVWGITQAFYDTTQLVVGQNRAEALAQGIYTALVTTMTGLMIAIPAAVLSHYFENRIVGLLNEIEEFCFNLLPQFERYEGKLRFTTGVPVDEDIVIASDENKSSDSAALPPPPQTAKGRR
jgi:biopolymer transport protein ExbB